MPEPADLLLLPELALLPPGATFGSYVVQGCIGQGAMGSVYRAEHALLKKPVALKLMGSALLDSLDARQRFLREGQAAAAIKHPNVVDITDVGVHDSTPYLVMELLEGEDLESYLEKHKHLDEQEVAELVLPIVAALGAAHSRGVVHCDLKPSNIFLAQGPDGEVVPKVLDFGISKLSTGLAMTDFESTPFNQLMGSPLYLPPEAVHGGQNLTPKSDQYSLGVILYECVTGLPPFTGDSLLSLLNAISAGDFAPPRQLRPSVSLAMERTVLRAMNPDPAQRFEHLRDVGAALLDVADLRTQVLWGRSFGRRELSEALSLRQTLTFGVFPPVIVPPPPRRRNLPIIVAAALAAIVLPSFWASRASPPVHLSDTSSLRSDPAQKQAESAEAPSPIVSQALPIATPPPIAPEREQARRWAPIATADEREPARSNERMNRPIRAPKSVDIEPSPPRSVGRVALLPEPYLLPPHDQPILLAPAELPADEEADMFLLPVAPPTRPASRVPRSDMAIGVNDAPIFD